MPAAEFFPGFEARHFTIDGLRLNAVIGGSGPLAVLIHGAPQGHSMCEDYRAAASFFAGETVA